MEHLKILTGLLKQANFPETLASIAHISGEDPVLSSPFLIGTAGATALAALGIAAEQLQQAKTGETQEISISTYEAALAQRSHMYIRVLEKEIAELWSPISGFYQTRDQRWIQLHCNFPNHRLGVVEFLQCADDKEAVTQAILQHEALALETALSEQGLCAAMVRSPEEWAQHPQAQAVAQLPLFEITKIADAPAKSLPAGDYPLSGIKVLDLTRVVAGPVCGKSLAEFGATVMRIASPHLPAIEPLVIDTGFGKLSAFVDLNNTEDKTKFNALLKDADVFLQAYRPGGLAERGYTPSAIATMAPGCIIVELSAYSHVGPWAQRHGYDSLVQSATGIAATQGSLQKPQHLPAQSLDYITGWLAAFAAMVALKRRATEGGSYHVRLSLAQTAHWFKNLGRVEQFADCKNPTR
jgi:crotonobetainyl-CoA:carnitine CoA-transferase CaiB-like acyl-CoA transferase